MSTKTDTTKAAADAKAKPKTGNVYKAQYRTNLKTTTNKKGQVRIDNDDQTAKALRDKSLDEIYSLAAKELGETQKALRERYGHLNTGMQRMNLGNRIRGAKARKARTAAAKKQA